MVTLGKPCSHIIFITHTQGHFYSGINKTDPGDDMESHKPKAMVTTVTIERKYPSALLQRVNKAAQYKHNKDKEQGSWYSISALTKQKIKGGN